MNVAAELEPAREAHRRHAWADAYDQFLAIDHAAPLDTEDLERLAETADMLGRGDDAIRVLQRVYQARVDAGDIGGAVRCAFWLWHALVFNAEFAHAGGWIARAGRLVETRPECAEQGYLLLPEAERRHGEGDYAAAFATAGRAAELGTRCGDRHLVTVAAHIKLRQTVSGRLRTLAGAEQFCAIRSYLATAAKHGIHFLESLVALAQGCPWLPETA